MLVNVYLGQVVDRKCARQNQAAVGHRPHRQDIPIGFVVDLANDLLQQIFDGDDSRNPAALVDNDGELFAFSLESSQRVRDWEAVRQLEGLSRRLSDGDVLTGQVTQMHHSDHVIQVVRTDHRCQMVRSADGVGW